MTIYVDDMRAPYGRMVMCHMLSDLPNPSAARNELDEMADRIGVARKWVQKSGTPEEHYDVSLTAKAKAVRFGAIECDRKKIVEIIKAKRPIRNDVPKCIKCDVTIDDCPLFRNTSDGVLPPKQWICEPCGGIADAETQQLLSLIADAL